MKNQEFYMNVLDLEKTGSKNGKFVRMQEKKLTLQSKM